MTEMQVGLVALGFIAGVVLTHSILVVRELRVLNAAVLKMLAERTSERENLSPPRSNWG